MSRRTHSERVIGLLATGGPEDWDHLAARLEDFPDGKDPYYERHWITHAIAGGTGEAVCWMLRRGVRLDFRDDEGRTVLHSAIERPEPDRYRLLETLIEAGADVNAKGFNDWTPLHMAGARGDLEALEILLLAGAERRIRTAIDDCATPAEEARNLGQPVAAAFIEGFGRRKRRKKG